MTNFLILLTVYLAPLGGCEDKRTIDDESEDAPRVISLQEYLDLQYREFIMSESLYSISAELLRLAEIAEAFELSEEEQQQIAVTQQNLATKVNGYCHVITMLGGNVELGNREIGRIQGFVKAKQRAIERLEKSLLNAVLNFGEEDRRTGVKRLESESFRLSTKKNPGPIYHDESRIPQQYYKADVKIKNLTVQQAELLRNLIATNGIDIAGETVRPVVDVTISIDKATVKQKLKDGEEIEGATWDDERFSLTIK